MCILGKLQGAEIYWFGNLRAEREEPFNVLMNGSVRVIYIREWFGGKVGEIFTGR